MNIHVRDIFISQSAFDAIPVNRQEQIKKLVKQFQASGYIDARTEIGPDQWARMSEKRRNQISETASKVFRIEEEIKELLKTDEQLAKEQEQRNIEALANRRKQLENRINQIEQFLPRKLASKRNNATKREYQELKAQVEKLS